MVATFDLPSLASINWGTVLVGAVAGTLAYIFVTQFLGHQLPRLWVKGERRWWRTALGDSPASRLVIRQAEKELFASIDEKEMDERELRSVAVLKVIFSRWGQYPSLTDEYKRMTAGRSDELFRKALKRLNQGWRSGTPTRILDEHIRVIEDSEHDEKIDKKDRMQGMSSVAMVKYALGDLDYGQRKGKEIWDDADDLKGDDKVDAKWMAAYAYFNSTMFLGHFEKAMGLMVRHWNGCYTALDEAAKERLRLRLADVITLNPVLVIPRHVILAAAFNDGPVMQGRVVKELYWPGKAQYRSYAGFAHVLGKLETEIMWLESWYDEAVRICTPEPDVESPELVEADKISLNFSHAYAGFYLTLLLGEAQTEEQAADLHARINRAFDSIDALSPIVSQYVKYGFSGVYHFACGENRQALRNLRIAAESSAISGNKFAECIFICCHAVAAARLSEDEDFLDPEIIHYLAQAEVLARKIGGFYPALYSAARSAVAALRRKEGEAKKYALRSAHAEAGKRLLKLFREPPVQPSQRTLPTGDAKLLTPGSVPRQRV